MKHITVQQCRDMLLQDLGWQDRSFVPMDYEMVEERAADVAEEKLNSLLERIHAERKEIANRPHSDARSAPKKKNREVCL